MTSFSSFWFGTLSPYETSCIASFVDNGYEFNLYSYESIENLPTGVKNVDAGEIVDRSYLNRFITNGKTNVAAFSDYFRCLMFIKTENCWVDTDVFMLKSFEIEPNENFIVVEDERNICNAILRLDGKSNELKANIANTEILLDRDVPWAATQSVIVKTYRKKWNELGSALRRSEEYMPIHYNDFYKFLLPEYADECFTKCSQAKSIHLYNNALDRIGVYKYLLPPEGSYLNRLFTTQGYTSAFLGTYPAAVMRNLVEGWRMRFSGECLGIKSVVKQAIPSVARTARRIRWKYF
jgi:hypothetical protein